MIRLTTNTGITVYVNVDHIVMVEESSGEDRKAIVHLSRSTEDFLWVQEPPEPIVEAIVETL